MVDGHATAPSGSPVGLKAAKKLAAKLGLRAADVARCHIIGAQLGGSNRAKDNNLSPCWQTPTNVPGMQQFEEQVRIHSRGAIVLYSVTPVYASALSTIPKGYTLRATSSTTWGQIIWSNAVSVPNAKYSGGHSYVLAN